MRIKRPIWKPLAGLCVAYIAGEAIILFLGIPSSVEMVVFFVGGMILQKTPWGIFEFGDGNDG